MINIESITQDDINIIGELFFEDGHEVFVSNSAKFIVGEDEVKCVSSSYVHPESDEDLVAVEMKIQKVKKIVEEVFRCKFVDLRQQVNN
jgi:hypothetical protein